MIKRIIIFLTYLYSSMVMVAQAQNIFTNNNGIIAIERGVYLTIQGNAANNGKILNEGELRLSGDWDNSGDYSSVSGTFVTNGADQLFNPGNATYAYFVVDNNATILLADLDISKEITLSTGIVSADDEAKLSILEGATISGGNESSYITGPLFTYNQGDIFFPIGTPSEYLPVELGNVQVIDSVGMQAFSTRLDALQSNEIDQFSPNRYWKIFNNPAFSANEITLPLKSETFIESKDEAIIAFTKDPADPLTIIGVPSISGSLSSGSITSSFNISSGYYVIADQSITGPPITVVNVVTSLQDGKHDFLRIENIEFYENNLVEIYDRQGVKVFEMSGYNNTDRVFRGSSNVGGRGMLTTGSYYYTVKLTGSKREAGFIYVKN